MTDLGFNIGSVGLTNPLVMAPMAGVTNPPFRRIVKEHGAALVFTEMVSATGLVRDATRTVKLLAMSADDHPLAVQLFGADPDTLAEAATLAQDSGAALVDLNMGCPVRKVVRHGAGAALLKDLGLVRKIVTKMRQALAIPLTVKTRSGWREGQGEVLDLIPILAEAGVDALTLHPRWAVQGFGGRADWDLTARAAERFPGPVIGNGDITRPGQVLTRLKETGCAGIMIGRGALGNPWIFSQALCLLEGRPAVEPDLDARLGTAERHARRLKDHLGPDRAAFMLRSVLMWYTKGLADSAAFRRSINQIRDYDRLMAELKAYFGRPALRPGQAEPARREAAL